MIQRNKQKITSEMLTNKDSLQRILNYDEGYKFLKPVRGSPVFWQSVQKDLFSMVRQTWDPNMVLLIFSSGHAMARVHGVHC